MATDNASPAGRSTTMNQRMQAINDRTQAPMACPDCGSTFFFQIRAEEFSNSGYGTAQIRSLSMNQEPAYLCLCGHIVDIKEAPQGRGSESQRARFLTSLKNAIAAHSKKNLQGIAKEFASIHEFRALLEKVEWLEQAVESLANGGEETEEETGEVPADGAGEKTQGEGPKEGTQSEQGTQQSEQPAAGPKAPAPNGGRTGRPQGGRQGRGGQ